MQKWEYSVFETGKHQLCKEIDEYGIEGWELVNVVSQSDTTALIAFFKRPKIEDVIEV